MILYYNEVMVTAPQVLLRLLTSGNDRSSDLMTLMPRLSSKLNEPALAPDVELRLIQKSTLRPLSLLLPCVPLQFTVMVAVSEVYDAVVLVTLITVTLLLYVLV